MNKQLILGYITQNDSEWLMLSIEAMQSIADKIIIVDGGSDQSHLDRLDKFIDGNTKFVVVHSKYAGNNGLQYQTLLNEVMKHKTSDNDWLLVLDSDEVVDDNAHLLREYMDADKSIYNIKMVHCVNNLRTVDATENGMPKFNPNFVHHVLARFYRLKDGIYYPGNEHTIIQGFTEPEMGVIDNVTIWHYGKAKAMYDLKLKYEMNMKRSNIHNKDFLNWWYKSYLNGVYPVKQLDKLNVHPSVVKREFYIGDEE